MQSLFCCAHIKPKIVHGNISDYWNTIRKGIVMRDLYFIQNIMIFIEECMVKTPESDDRYTINPFYIKNAETFINLQKDIMALFPNLRFIPYSDCVSHRWDTIYMSSYMQEQYQGSVTRIASNEIILVEDGLFDYTEQIRPYPFYDGKKLYIFNPSAASSEAKHADVRGIIMDRDIMKIFEENYKSEIDILKALPDETPILFTSPLEEDFFEESPTQTVLDFLYEEMGIRKFILKRHPRDYGIYRTDGMQIFECPQNIPGQFVDRAFHGKKIYLFPSTVSFMSDTSSDIVFLNPMPQNREYSKQFNGILKSNLFKNRQSIHIMTMNTAGKNTATKVA